MAQKLLVVFGLLVVFTLLPAHVTNGHQVEDEPSHETSEYEADDDGKQVALVEQEHDASESDSHGDGDKLNGQADDKTGQFRPSSRAEIAMLGSNNEGHHNEAPEGQPN